MSSTTPLWARICAHEHNHLLIGQSQPITNRTPIMFRRIKHGCIAEVWNNGAAELAVEERVGDGDSVGTSSKRLHQMCPDEVLIVPNPRRIVDSPSRLWLP